MSEETKNKEKDVDYEGLLSDKKELDIIYEKFADNHENSLMFSKGLMLGLIFGIIGNFFVQFFYVVIEGITFWSFKPIFYVSVILSVSSLLVILYWTKKYRKEVLVRQNIMDTITRMQTKNLEAISYVQQIIDNKENKPKTKLLGDGKKQE